MFASRDAAECANAQHLAEVVSGRFVNRLSSKLEDLELVARFRVVEPVCIVVLIGGRVAARIPRLVSEEILRADIAGIT